MKQESAEKSEYLISAEEQNVRVSLFALLNNIFLSAIKLYAALTTGSLAILSDAVNSITDILSSLSVFMALRVASKKPDETHHYGHHTAEPIAGLIVSVFAAVVGFEVVKSGIMLLIRPHSVSYSVVALAVLSVSVILKASILILIRHACSKKESPALEALWVDYRNDIFITFIAVSGYVAGSFFKPSFDFAVALLLGFFILYSSFDIGRRNVLFLMGASPPKRVLDNIRKTAGSVDGVEGTNDIFAHYFGNKIHAEVHVNLSNKLTTPEAHDIGKEVQRKVEAMPSVSRAFVHIDPEKSFQRKTPAKRRKGVKAENGEKNK